MRRSGSKSPVPDTPVTMTIVEQVAEKEGVEPVDLTPLYRVIDTEALEKLLVTSSPPPSENTVRVEFRYCGYNITVEGPNQINVTE